MPERKPQRSPEDMRIAAQEAKGLQFEEPQTEAANEAPSIDASALEVPEAEALEQHTFDTELASLEARFESMKGDDLQLEALLQDMRDALEEDSGSDHLLEAQQNAIRKFAVAKGLEGKLYAEDVDPDVSELEGGAFEDVPDVSADLMDVGVSAVFDKITEWASSNPEDWKLVAAGNPEVAALVDNPEAYQQALDAAESTGSQKDLRALKKMDDLLSEALNHMPGMQEASYESTRWLESDEIRPTLSKEGTPLADVPAEYAWAQKLFTETMNSPEVEQSVKDELAAFDIQAYSEAQDRLEALQSKGWLARKLFNRGAIKRAEATVQVGADLLARMQRAVGAEVDTVVKAPIGGLDTSAPYSNAPRSGGAGVGARLNNAPDLSRNTEQETTEDAPTILELANSWPDNIADKLEVIANGTIKPEMGLDLLKDASGYVDWLNNLESTQLQGVRKPNGEAIPGNVTIANIRKNSSKVPTVYLRTDDGRRVSMALEGFLKANMDPNTL